MMGTQKLECASLCTDAGRVGGGEGEPGGKEGRGRGDRRHRGKERD